MGCPFGFSNPRKATGLKPIFFQLKKKASEIAFDLMEESGLNPLQMQDVCMSTLLSYRVRNAQECKNSVQLLYDKHYTKFTKLCVALQDLELYMTTTFSDEPDEQEQSVYHAVAGLVGYTTFHDQEKFKSMIVE